MSDIFKEVDERLASKTSKFEARIRLGWRLILAWMIFCGLGALGVVYIAVHFLLKFW